MSALEDAVAAVSAADQALLALNPAPFPLPARGLEALIAGGFSAMERGECIFPGLRERVGAVLRGCPVERLVDPTAGARPYRIAPVSGSPDGRLLHAVGVAIARPDEAVLCFMGQGSASYGAFHEAMNLAALHKARVIFVAGCWTLGDDAPLAPQLAAGPARLAAAHGLATWTVDGADAGAVRDAVATAREAGGPALVEARLRRGGRPAEPSPEAGAAPAGAALAARTVSELKALARAAGVAGYSRMKKAELIAALS